MEMPDHYATFEFGRFYHVFNRSNNREAIFLSADNYQYFLKLVDKYLSGLLEMYCYCLIPNHFHFMVRVKEPSEITSAIPEGSRSEAITNETDINNLITEQYRKFFIAYSMAFNKQQGRNGNLFHRRFKRILVKSDSYFSQLVYYIHLNPVKHKLTNDYVGYRWSSYNRILDQKPTKLMKQQVLEWFGGRERFMDYHKEQLDLYRINDLIVEE